MITPKSIDIHIGWADLKDTEGRCHQCFREKPHCVKCGSRQVYRRDSSGARLNLAAGALELEMIKDLLPDGSKIKIKIETTAPTDTVRIIVGGFVCQKCGNSFNILTPCNAKTNEKLIKEAEKISAEAAALPRKQEHIAKVRAEQGNYAAVEEALRLLGPKSDKIRLRGRSQPFDIGNYEKFPEPEELLPVSKEIVPKASEAPDIFDLEAKARQEELEDKKQKIAPEKMED